MTATLLRFFRRSERGQILVLGVFLSTFLLGMVGLVVDGGFLVSQKRQTQNAADAAALAGVHRLFEGASTSAVLNAATAYARENGYEDDGVNTTVTVNVPPTQGDHAGDNKYVEVIITEKPRSFFIHAIVPGRTTVAARGVAGTIEVPRLYALLALDEDDCSSYYQHGSVSVIIQNGGVMVNSACAADALSKSGSGLFTADGTIDTKGGYSVGGGATSPTPRTVPWTVPDPLADLPPPNRADYPVRHGTCASPATRQVSSTTTLQPGVYHGGLLIEGGGGVTVTLSPGVYYMAGGGFIKRGSSALVGDGVLIYDAPPPTAPGCASPLAAPATRTDCGYTIAPRRPLPICLEGGGPISVTAHTSGLYKDLLFWQDVGVTTTFRHAGNAHASVGAIYNPGALLDTAGGADLGTTQIITKKFEARGNGTVGVVYNAFFDTVAPSVALVE